MVGKKISSGLIQQIIKARFKGSSCFQVIYLCPKINLKNVFRRQVRHTFGKNFNKSQDVTGYWEWRKMGRKKKKELKEIKSLLKEKKNVFRNTKLSSTPKGKIRSDIQSDTRLIRKDPDTGKDWRQKKKRTEVDVMVESLIQRTWTWVNSRR